MLDVLTSHRYLLGELVRRDIYSRYLGSLAGIFWSVLNPLLQLGLYTLIFAVVLGQRIEGLETPGGYALGLFAALIPWMALQESLVRSAGVWIENAALVKKARFPLELLPASRVLSAVAHQALSTVLFAGVLLGLGLLNGPWVLLLVPLLLFQALLMHGLGVCCACLNVFFRDVAQLLGVGMMALFWMTPIVYPKSKAPGLFRLVLDCNPLTHLVEAYRFLLLGQPAPSIWGQAYWMGLALAAFLLGRRLLERARAEVLDTI